MNFGLNIMKNFTCLFLLFLPLFSVAQETRFLKGKVTDEEGITLPGASVYVDKNAIGEKSEVDGVVKQYRLGTTTDIDGLFSLQLPASVQRLKCSFIGYKTQEIELGTQEFVTIVLLREESLLDEVVVTGYQEIAQRKLTSSIVKVEAADILQANAASIDLMLEGQLAGVQASAVNGAPGAPAKIRIRGTASLKGTQDPLWVLDGVPLEGTDLPDFSDKNIDQLFTTAVAGINPSDIADITILKDAAATAIYGARAANGVILITTKKGKEGKMRIDLALNTAFVEKPDMSKLNLMNASEKLDLELGLAKYKDLDAFHHHTKKGAVAGLFEAQKLWDTYRKDGFDGLPEAVKAKINNLRQVNTPWANQIYQTAVNQHHSLSISGGSERATYYFSAGYYKERGTTMGTAMERLNFTLKSTYKLRPNLQLGAAIYTNGRTQNSYLTTTGLHTNPSHYLRTVNPYLKIRDDKGAFVYDPEIPLLNSRYVPFNIIEERENTSNRLKTRSLNTVLDLSWTPFKHLNFRTQLGLQHDNGNTTQYGHKNSYFARLEREKSRVGDNYFIPEGGVMKHWENSQAQWNWKNILEYNYTHNYIHEFSLMAGNELRRTKRNGNFSAGYGFNKETLTTKPVVFPDEAKASSFPLFRKSYVENAFVSFFGTLGYTFKQKYTFFGSLRTDGSDLFGADPKYRYQPLWAVSAAWRIKEEGIFKQMDWLNALKLRLSYGTQGNIDKGTSKFIIGEKKIIAPLPGQTEIGIVSTNLPNEQLRWEKTTTTNIGFDLSVWANRIRLSFDHYLRKSTNLIGTRSLPLENGLATVALNWAAMTNKGFELNLITQNIDTKNFRWTTTFNISKNTNTVDKIHVPENQSTPSLLGHSVNALFAFKTAGLDEQGYVRFEKYGKTMNAEMFFDLVDPSGWGYYQTKLSTKEIRNRYTYIGSKDPKFSGGIINNVTYKNFSLTISCSYQLDKWVKITPFYSLLEMDRGKNRTTQMNQVWTPDRKTGNYPRMISAATADRKRLADYGVFNPGFVLANDVFRDLDLWHKKISFLRINSIRFGYGIPEKLLEKVKVSAARLTLEMRNPFVFATGYQGYFDPETYGNIWAQPIARSIGFGLHLSF